MYRPYSSALMTPLRNRLSKDLMLAINNNALLFFFYFVNTLVSAALCTTFVPSRIAEAN